MIGAASRGDREGSGEFGNSDVFLCIVQFTKRRFSLFHDSLLATALLGSTYIMNIESWLGLRVTGLCWIYCSSHTQHQVLNGRRFVCM